jgi:prepilin-type processing-associated H-X9-DG protein
MSRTRVVLLILMVLILLGLTLPLITRSRARSDRVSCQNHLRDLGLLGVRHASTPGKAIPERPRPELPTGTFLNPALAPDLRMSWFVYTLTLLNEGPPAPDPEAPHRRPVGLDDLLKGIDTSAAWNAEHNQPLANYRLASAICPAQVRPYPPGQPVPTNYIACGGLGVDTPSKPLDEAGERAGAYRYDSPTPNSAFKDGLQHTAQIIETNSALGPWLQGGPSTLRGLDPDATPYLGVSRPFGGCHPGGAYVSFADGSVRFIIDTVDPAIFRAMWTLAGGPSESSFEGP